MKRVTLLAVCAATVALAAAGCETVFEDQGLSGVTAARPGLRAALEGAGEAMATFPYLSDLEKSFACRALCPLE